MASSPSSSSSQQLRFPASAASQLERHLPPLRDAAAASAASAASVAVAVAAAPDRPFVTLTYATSLDSSISLAPGVRTRLSGPATQCMTHHVRSRHAGILIGVSTLLADNPRLNCRVGDGQQRQPRPVVLDPGLRWTPSPSRDKVLLHPDEQVGLAPWVLTRVPLDQVPSDKMEALHRAGGKYIHLEGESNGEGEGQGEAGRRFAWNDVFRVLGEQGLSSIMVEGGANVINSLLAPRNHGLVDSVIVTIAPTWLGRGGVDVSPDRVLDGEGGMPMPVARLSGVSWLPMGDDVVLCGRLRG